MLFNSLSFLIFFPLVFALYWKLKDNLKGQNLLLLIASYIFYGWWDWRFLTLIIISSLADFLIGLSIGNQSNQKKRKLLLFGSLIINLGFLLTFKYFNFFVGSFAELVTSLGFEANLPTLNIVLPVGISFYTFQTLSYTIDIYRNRMAPTKSALTFFTYVAFFPQLVAGPIERAANLLPQIEKPRHFEYSKAVDGLRQILWGFFKKVVIADNCAVIADSVFNNYSDLNGLVLVVGAIAFSIQIYCDFSGYSDIAIGTARLLGINLMQNFATPYFSRNISEFWRRWHISLSTWFRDYVYIPLGGSRVNKIKQIRNIFAIFLVSGFWHGANWTFIFWGLIHSLFYIPQVFSKTNRRYLNTVAENKLLPSLIDIFKILRTYIVVTIAWIFFRSNSIQDSFSFIKRMFEFENIDNYKLFFNVLGIKMENFLLLLFFIFIGILSEWRNRIHPHGLFSLPKNIIIRYTIYLLLVDRVFRNLFSEQTFIYFQF